MNTIINKKILFIIILISLLAGCSSDYTPSSQLTQDYKEKPVIIETEDVIIEKESNINLSGFIDEVPEVKETPRKDYYINSRRNKV
jgi:hypothetical protein